MQGNHYAIAEPEATLATVLGTFATFTGNWSVAPALIRTSIFVSTRKSSSGNLQIDVD